MPLSQAATLATTLRQSSSGSMGPLVGCSRPAKITGKRNLESASCEADAATPCPEVAAHGAPRGREQVEPSRPKPRASESAPQASNTLKYPLTMIIKPQAKDPVSRTRGIQPSGENELHAWEIDTATREPQEREASSKPAKDDTTDESIEERSGRGKEARQERRKWKT